MMRVDLTRFPVDWILASRRFEEAVVRGCVWVLIPLEYVVLTRLPGGGGANDLAFAATAVVCVAIVLASGAVIAIYPRDASTYEERLRRLSVAMIVTWGVTLALLLVWYFSIWRFVVLGGGGSRDVLANPVAAGLRWLAVNFVFVFIAIALIVAASLWWRMRYASPHSNACNPNIFVVAGVNAVLMALVHGGAFHILRPRLIFLGAVVQGTALVIRPPLTVLGDVQGATFVSTRLTILGADVQGDVLVIRPPLTVLGAAIDGVASVIEPPFSGADVQALTASGAAP